VEQTLGAGRLYRIPVAPEDVIKAFSAKEGK
jgi:hypothetical protein